ncbi:MAG: ABC transporter ATP-binding protein [Nocardioidaceae bacterium]|nr:ABC transporter ATP-binding protein [Nocardioidaceae bacterium]
MTEPVTATPNAAAESTRSALLSVRDLQVDLVRGESRTRLVDGVSLDLAAGETLCLVGESGSGKTLTAMSVMQLLPGGVEVTGGSVELGGRDLLRATTKELRAVRGNAIGLVSQDPMTALDPLVPVGVQVGDAIRAHDRRISKAAIRARVTELLSAVGIPNPAANARRHPHEFSGGMRQRVGIAIAMANRPRLIIADEPTTALDVTVQAQILDLLDTARRESGAAVLLITHDLGVVAERADRVLVMYAGKVVEQADVLDLFDRPAHAYTEALLRCSPGATSGAGEPIPGTSARAGALPTGCAFHPRCRIGADRPRCQQETPALLTLGTRHDSACHYPAEVTR